MNHLKDRAVSGRKRPKHVGVGLLLALLVAALAVPASATSRQSDGATPASVTTTTKIVEAASTTTTYEDVGAERVDPVTSPGELPDGPMSAQLAAAIEAIPEIAQLSSDNRIDFGDGPAKAGTVGMVADDGSRIDVVYQQLPEPLRVEIVGPPEITHAEVGPNGEELIVRVDDDAIQVVGMDSELRTVNIIIEKINHRDPSAESTLAAITVDQVKAWVASLLKTAVDQGWRS